MTRPHGVRGEVRVLEGQGSSGAWRQARQVRIGPEAAAAIEYQVRSVRGGGQFAILALEGIAGREQAEALRGKAVFVARDLLPAVEQDEFYAADLVGLQVQGRDGRVLGRLHEIFDNGAHEVYVVVDGRREILLPVIDGVVLEVDLEAGRMVVDPPAGLPGLLD